jgi:hypothetical protein
MILNTILKERFQLKNNGLLHSKILLKGINILILISLKKHYIYYLKLKINHQSVHQDNYRNMKNLKSETKTILIHNHQNKNFIL